MKQIQFLESFIQTYIEVRNREIISEKTALSEIQYLFETLPENFSDALELVKNKIVKNETSQIYSIETIKICEMLAYRCFLYKLENSHTERIREQLLNIERVSGQFEFDD
jgi:hypothetical protein